MRAPAQDGSAVRAHLKAAARRGQAAAIAALEGPPIPEALAYLYDWILELDAARGWDVTATGAIARALSYQDIDAWARLTDRQPEPHEVRALIRLDQVLRHPEVGGP
jgi:hypothetical protein